MSRTPKSDASRSKVDALRKSGYKGPVDQDGNAVADLDAWIDERLNPGQEGQR